MHPMLELLRVDRQRDLEKFQKHPYKSMQEKILLIGSLD